MSKSVAAIIPARGGSKGIPRKNIIELKGYPLIAYTIAAAKLSKNIERVIVSTDDKEIAEISTKFGAEAPFLRPKKYATDSSPDIAFVEHAIQWFKKHENYVPDYIVHLRPTTPLRDPKFIDTAINLLLRNSAATSLRSVHEIRESPYKLFEIKNNYLRGLFPYDPRPEYYNLPRQYFPSVYQPNGYVDILKSNFIIKSRKMHGNKMLAFITEDAGEIDKIDDLKIINYLLEQNNYVIFEYLKKILQ